MFQSFVDAGVLLALRKPNFIFGAIANILGIIYNALFQFIYGITRAITTISYPFAICSSVKR